MLKKETGASKRGNGMQPRTGEQDRRDFEGLSVSVTGVWFIIMQLIRCAECVPEFISFDPCNNLRRVDGVVVTSKQERNRGIEVK